VPLRNDKFPSQGFGNFDFEFYEMCRYCDHFIDVEWLIDDPDNPNIFLIHLDSGEKEHDHEPVRSKEIKRLIDWKAERPDLFTLYEDEFIGPNSMHFERTRFPRAVPDGA